MQRIVAGAAVLLAALLPAAAPAQGFRLGEVLVAYLPELRQGADTVAFERAVRAQLAPAWSAAAPGMGVHLVRAERGSGNRRGQYMVLWATDRQRRSGYVMAGGETPFASELVSRAGDPRAALAPYTQGGRWTEYQLLSPEKVGRLPMVEILGIHYIKVRPERRADFERFVSETLHPAVGSLRPDLRLLYYKGTRGEEAGSYITIFALTDASRDKYWPGGADSEDVRAAFAPRIRALADELRSYLVEGSYGAGTLAASAFESREWADFIFRP